MNSTSFTLNPNDGYRIETHGFSALSDTTANISFLHSGPLDNIGILLDWVKLEGDPIDAVPVPASLPLLAGGFALFGAIGIRRKKKA